MRKYQCPTEPFEAVQISAETYGDILKWLVDSGNENWSKYYGCRITLHGFAEVGPGDWICRSLNGTFYPLSEAAFNRYGAVPV